VLPPQFKIKPTANHLATSPFSCIIRRQSCPDDNHQSEEFPVSKTALEISISVPLPDDELDRADILHGMKESIGSFRNSLPEGSDFALRVLKRRPPVAKQSRPPLVAE
jgi:hypothetical protein